ncbi:MAG: hypothetical protein WCY19_06900 [Candidatus Gastranaerophilaceae bacterium]
MLNISQINLTNKSYSQNLGKNLVNFKSVQPSIFPTSKPSAVENNKKIKELTKNGVSIIDSKNTWIDKDTKIEEGTIIYPGCYIQGKNIIGKNNIIGPGTFIGGNVVIGENNIIMQSDISNTTVKDDCKVGPYAVLRNNVLINDKARAGIFVEIKNSKIGESSAVPHSSVISDATVGKNVNIGGHTGISNYNPLTGAKERAIIEDGAVIGGQVLLQSPVKIGHNAIVASKSFVDKDVPPDSLAISRVPFDTEKNIKSDWVKNKKIKSSNK